MSELLWPLFHEMKKRLDQLEAYLNRVHPDWNSPPGSVYPSVPDDYNEPTQTDENADTQTGFWPPDKA